MDLNWELTAEHLITSFQLAYSPFFGLQVKRSLNIWPDLVLKINETNSIHFKLEVGTQSADIFLAWNRQMVYE